MQRLFPVPESGITEKNPQRLFYAYDGENMSYAVVGSDGTVLSVDFIPGNLPSLRISVAESVQAWFDGVSPRFFGFLDEDVVLELAKAAEEHGVAVRAEIAEILAGE